MVDLVIGIGLPILEMVLGLSWYFLWTYFSAHLALQWFSLKTVDLRLLKIMGVVHQLTIPGSQSRLSQSRRSSWNSSLAFTAVWAYVPSINVVLCWMNVFQVIQISTQIDIWGSCAFLHLIFLSVPPSQWSIYSFLSRDSHPSPGYHKNISTSPKSLRFPPSFGAPLR